MFFGPRWTRVDNGSAVVAEADVVLVNLTTCNQNGVLERRRRLPEEPGHLREKSHQRILQTQVGPGSLGRRR